MSDVRELVRRETSDAIDESFHPLPVGLKEEVIEAVVGMSVRDLLAIAAGSRLILLHECHGGPLVSEGYIVEEDGEQRMRWQLNRPAYIYAVGGRLEYEEGTG